MPATLCNLKGRMKAIMDVILCHDYQLILAKDCIPLVMKDLKTIALFSKVKLHLSERYSVLGIIGDPKDGLLPEHFHLNEQQSILFTPSSIIYRVKPSLSIALMENEEADTLQQRFENEQRLIGSLAWHRCLLDNGGFSLYPSTSEALLPHKVSMEESDYVSFDKGCYKGQEVIARMHYKANIKHALRYFTMTSDVQPQLLQKLLDQETGQEVGELIDFYPQAEGRYTVATSCMKNFQGPPLLAE